MKVKLLVLTLLFLQLGLRPVEEPVEKVWVFFTDKAEQDFDPLQYFHPAAIERRILEEIPLFDFTDLPVNEDYIQAVEAITFNNRVVSRWFNAMCCLATQNQIHALRNLAFVASVKVVNQPLNKMVEASAIQASESVEEAFVPDEDQVHFMQAQLKRMGSEIFIKNNIDGKGVRVAIFDVGFKSYTTNPAFEHIRRDDRFVKTYDFVKKKENVDVGGSHGTSVLGCIGGRINQNDIGLATGAQFLLARTETWTEYFAEEENWLAAAEWADKNGAHIINSSLGYTYHRYFREDMDGQHSLVAKAANMAARKGILVVNSAGNEGSGDWKIIGSPADADSVLSIGGIEPETGIHTSFSSFGPTRDKRLKPNITAYGHVMSTSPKGLEETQGTSFSSPLTAGFVACAKQARPVYKNMLLFKEIEKSGDLFPYFDYAHGYGVPQAAAFFSMPKQLSPTFTFEVKNDLVYIRLKDAETTLRASDSATSIYFDRYVTFPSYVFYHIENKHEYLDKYFVVNPKGSFADKIRELAGNDENSPLAGEGPLVIKKKDYAKPYIIRVYYKGYTQELVVK